MDFIIAAQTDIGSCRKSNQDSLCVMKLKTRQGPMVFAVLCDGMGGLERGELASASVVQAMRGWALEELPVLCSGKLKEQAIRDRWMNLATEQNQKIKAYGDREGIRLGTTAVVMLLTRKRYYILNVGDSRVYEVASQLRQITWDQSVVAREVKAGRLTPEQAEKDRRRNILLQCIGGLDSVAPDWYTGELKTDAAYFLCSDGFRHELTAEELSEALCPGRLTSEETMDKTIIGLIGANKDRGEKDNISIALMVCKPQTDRRSGILRFLSNRIGPGKSPGHQRNAFTLGQEILFLPTDKEIP